MKKALIILIAFAGFLFTSCEGCSERAREAGENTEEALEEFGSDLEEVGEDALEKAEEVGSDMKEAGEKAADKLEQAGDSIEDAIDDSGTDK